MSRFDWKSLAMWKKRTPQREQRRRHGSPGVNFRPQLDALEGRALLSHGSIRAAAVSQTTGGAGGTGGGGGGGISLLIPGTGLTGAALGNDFLVNGELPVVHVFNKHGKVIGVMPVLTPQSLASIVQRTGGPGGLSSGGGGGFAILIAPTLPTTLPKYGLAHGKLYRIFPPPNLGQQPTITQQTGGPGGAGGGGGGGVSILIPVPVTIPTTTFHGRPNVVKIFLVTGPPTVVSPTITQTTGGAGGSNAGGGGGIGLIL